MCNNALIRTLTQGGRPRGRGTGAEVEGVRNGLTMGHVRGNRHRQREQEWSPKSGCRVVVLCDSSLRAAQLTNKSERRGQGRQMMSRCVGEIRGSPWRWSLGQGWQM